MVSLRVLELDDFLALVLTFLHSLIPFDLIKGPWSPR
jgi:hypothetical protein